MSDFSPEQIKAAYVELCKTADFSVYLKKPSDARIKKECLSLYQKKNTSSDQQVLRNFLGLREQDDVALALKKIDAGKFKPVVSFFKKTTNPRDETIELVAWLIQFKFGDGGLGNDDVKNSINLSDSLEDKRGEKGKDMGGDNVLTLAPPITSSNELITKTLQIDIKNSKSSRLIRNLIISVVLFVMFISIFVLKGIMPFKKDTRLPNTNEKCMYWNGYQYEPVVCQDTIYASKKVIPLNMKELVNLKKIDRPDTLTINDLGKVWYNKINNQLQLFTSSGRFPIDTNRVLKPLSKYMYFEHIAYKFDGLYKWRVTGYIIVIVGLLTTLIDYFLMFLMKKRKLKVNLDRSLLSSR